jgi:polysaccharide biosynthesis protein PelA
LSVRTLGILSVAALMMVVVASGNQGPSRWAVYYAAEAEPIAFAPYATVVLDGDRHPPIGPLIERGKTVLGYLSLCEVASTRAYFAEVQAEGVLLGEHPHWKGTHYVDIRDPRWSRRVIEDLVPRLLRRGFTGVFLDTLDDAAYQERQLGRRGMRDAAIQLVKSIRRQYPDVMLMMNRGYDLLPALERDVDAVLAESLYGTYDFAARWYRRVSPADTATQLDVLRAARQRRPSLRLFALDYWDPADADGIADLYRAARAAGFESYVATIELDRLVPEPR